MTWGINYTSILDTEYKSDDIIICFTNYVMGQMAMAHV